MVTADDFASGTRAAIAGGTATPVDFFTQNRGCTLAQALEKWRRKVDGRSSCDYAFHMAITDWNPAVSDEIDVMTKVGVTSYKVYLAYDNLRLRDGELYEILKRVGRAHSILDTHCENGDLANAMIAERRDAGEHSRQLPPSLAPTTLWGRQFPATCISLRRPVCRRISSPEHRPGLR